MSNSTNQPIYFIPPGHPDIAYWENVFVAFTDSETHTLNLTINPETVDTLDVARIQQLSFAIQHQHALIEKFVFAINFNFRQVSGGELYYQELDWKSELKYYNWFFRMSSQPHLLFFIEDHDARFYFLMGDWLAAGKVNVQHTGGKVPAVNLNAEQVQEMANRVYNCCRMFNLFCHGTGFNPKPYIEAVIAEYNFEESNMQTLLDQQYLDDLASGIKLSVVPLKNHPDEE